MADRQTRRRRRRRKKTGSIVLMVVVVAAIVIGGFFLYDRYAPTTEHMSLEEYYPVSSSDEAVVILNGTYDPKDEHEIDAIISAEVPYINIYYLKTKLDDGYVYDNVEGILRYTTDKELISADRTSARYTVGRDPVDFTASIIMEAHDGVYINMDFVSLYTDIGYSYIKEPNRLIIETAGTTKQVTTLNRDTAVRRFGGPKSKILEDATKDESVWVLENYGKWSSVLTEKGVVGCVENKCLGELSNETVAFRLPEREYTHNLMDSKVVAGWHPIYSSAGNGNIGNAIANATNMNVIIPTWYQIADNAGNINSHGSTDYVNTAHNRGIRVWAMVSNFEVQGVDSTSVLNRTSSRDNLVNSLIAAAIRDNVDGINIDFESLSVEARDGFIQFIREISLRCKSNALVLSVVNYKPMAHTSFYNRAEQAKYADYVMCVGYDEYHSTSEEAGSNASYPFCAEGVRDTLLEVPPEQLILALPFYTRMWTMDASGLSNRSLGMSEAIRQVEAAGAQKQWLEEEQQYYVEYEKDGKTNKVWLEDEQSLAAKLALVRDNNLAGAAFWRLGFEPASIWGVIQGYVR